MTSDVPVPPRPRGRETYAVVPKVDRAKRSSAYHLDPAHSAHEYPESPPPPSGEHAFCRLYVLFFWLTMLLDQIAKKFAEGDSRRSCSARARAISPTRNR